VTDDDLAVGGVRIPRTLARRLLPLQIGVFLQGCMLWVPVEKLFQTQIGFDAASIGVMAAAYAAVVPLLEVPSGILADRWSRNGIMVAGSIALAASSLLGGLSTDVATYIAAAMILGVYFALSSGTVDSVVYDAVLEQTGSSAVYETWIGRVRIVESVALAGSALVGGVLADWTSTRFTYVATVPFALASVVAFLRFDEPRLHRAGAPESWRRHVVTTFRAMVGLPAIRRIMLLAALTGLLSQTVFEFGPLWLVALRAPAAAFGPYWAVLVATLGLGGYLTGKLGLGRPLPVLALAAGLAVAPLLLATSRSLIAVVLAQSALQLLLAIVAVHVGLLLHDAVPSSVRAGVSSGVGTLSWVLFLPFSLVFGGLARTYGVQWSGWVLVTTAVGLALLLAATVRTRAALQSPADLEPDPDVVPEPDAVPAPPPAELACRDLVTLVTSYLDGALPGDWRDTIEHHLGDCDGCTNYLDQIRTTVAALEQLEANAADGRPGS